jgi:hypothetical protein
MTRSEGEATATGSAPSLINVNRFTSGGRKLRGGTVVPGIQFKDDALFLERVQVGKGWVYHASFLQVEDPSLALWERKLLDGHGIEVPMEIVSRDGRLLPSVLVSHIPDGDTHSFGIVYSTHSERYQRVPAILKLKQKRHVYDVRKRSYLGEVDRIPVTLDPMEPLLLYALPKPIPDFSIAVPAKPVPRGGMLDLEINLPRGTTAQYLFKVWLETPDGKTLEPFVRKKWGSEKCRAAFRIAHNDPSGKWKVNVREVVSGRRVCGEVTVGE